MGRSEEWKPVVGYVGVAPQTINNLAMGNSWGWLT